MVRLISSPVGANVFEPQTLPGVLEVFFDADQPCWRLGNAQPPFWTCSHAGITLDQASERGAKHHSTEQWRVRKLGVARIFSACARNQKQC